MVFKKKEKAVEEEFTDDGYEEEYEEEVPEPPQRKLLPTSPIKQENKEQQIDVGLMEILTNHEQRIKEIEAALFRLRHI